MKKKVFRFLIVKKDICKIVIILILLVHVSDAYAKDTTYYVDNKNGNDNNDGYSTTKPWKTLEKLNKITFNQGNKIFLRRGQIFKGSLQLTGNGTPLHPIKLSAYGTGKRPVINSPGSDYSLQLMDAQGWEISDIETERSNKAGIYIGCTKDSLRMEYFRVTNCYVHDIGDTSKIDWNFSKSTGGIIVVNGTVQEDGKPVFYNSVFNNVIINNCTVRYNHRWTCLSISSGQLNGKRGNANYIKNCTAEYSSADGIRMNGVQNSFIEYCVMYRNGAWPNYPGKNLGGLGAWFFNAENCTIQFCEASHVQAASTDGGAFDIDYDQKNSTVQYCYGHDCAGYGVSVFGADSNMPTENSVVRYNVLSNNGRNPAFAYEGDFFVYTWGGGLLNGVKIYNNTSYWNPAADSAAVKIDADFTGNNPNIFANNIVYSKRAKMVYLKNDTMKCDNNIYWVEGNGKSEWKRKNKIYHALAEWQKNTGQETHSLFADPMMTDPVYHERGFPKTQFNLKKGSPAINTAVVLEGMGKRDFFGNKTPDKSGKYDIGAYEYSAQKSKQTDNKTGASAYSFSLPNRHNNTISLKDFSGSTTLLSFINLDNPQVSQSQLTFIKSIKRQYDESGLRIILIDESSSKNKNSSDQTLTNFIADNELNDVVFLLDKNGKATRKFDVDKFPATLLITKEGVIQNRWGEVAQISELAMAIEKDLSENILVKHFDN